MIYYVNDIEPNEAYNMGIMWLSTYVNMFWLLNHVVVFFYEHHVALL